MMSEHFKKGLCLVSLSLLLGALILTVACTPAVADPAPTGWFPQNSGTTNSLIDVEAVDANTAWVVGSATPGYPILKTTNGGETWTPQASDVAPFAISAVNANVAWGVGWNAQIIKTTNGGATWQLQFSVPTSDVIVVLFDVVAVDANTAYVVGYTCDMKPTPRYYDLIMKTVDGGTTWNGQYSAGGGYYSAAFNGVDAVNGLTACAVGYNVDYAGASIMRTNNGGALWSKQNPGGTYYLSGIDMLNGNLAWASGIDSESNGAVLKTKDGGLSWTRMYSGLWDNLTGISAYDSDIAWAVGGHNETGVATGIILRTTNGTTWHSQDPGTTARLNRIDSVDPNTAWAVGENGTILHTVDGGEGDPVCYVKSITPNFGVQGTVVSITDIAGNGFKPGAVVRIQQGTTIITATDADVVSTTKITCRLNLTGAPFGKYDVVVTNPDGPNGRLTQGFRVTNICGAGAGSAVLAVGLMMGLLSIAGSGELLRRSRKKS